MWTILLLTVSNVFMTFAWYGHLKWFKDPTKAWPVWLIVLLSWGIAFFEYCFQVPGNRIGAELEGYSVGQLKVLQEIITLAVFVAFSISFMGAKLSWNYYAAFALMAGAACLVFLVR